MFKERRFLIGLGAGVIIGSLLLQLTLIGERAAEPLTEAELRREAERAGYELIPQGAMADGTPEGGGAAQPPTPASGGAPSKEEGAEKKAAGGSGQAAKPGSSAEKKQDPPPAEKKQAPPLTEEKQEAKIKVAYGSGSRDIAKQLADAGIVESAEEFERYVAKQKKQGKLRTGTFLFPVPSTMEEALRILTSKPNG
ncbi:endolytic transglycosylase MltG [Paenibacillus thiaminolyticus]|uniref:Endolytic transglycosylase MltG n=1 Tax=Paenibacillus thiaminolyticus TaxID=49283 RepID=A0AAP9DYV2_PANTH|nr:endolytic transglycosylase MltG [Paenibacillus thiaminolyticus]MCY9537004.1 endolytic transglycosylase MltG [Paenibacillus thiaminolyticus]MCY9603238.1 endolytic transglycosylase MltG [Paenibacillus thiaminolyticus]MCY9608067.1 endolytic transglycosylase MltG [Paenibacillus thiaminolyticus]MCY9613685.1 endolytic transglycosylase MltG [Paenibacillus thiaminolyticus]MCY9618847.1 endolytic transglycosylase MltG [Paenibacillus thiaminolyticus]